DGRRILVIGRTADVQDSHELVILDAASGAELATRPVPFLLLDTAWVDDTHALGAAFTGERAPTLRLFDLTDGSSTPVMQGLAVSTDANTTPDRKTAVSSQWTA